MRDPLNLEVKYLRTSSSRASIIVIRLSICALKSCILDLQLEGLIPSKENHESQGSADLCEGAGV